MSALDRLGKVGSRGFVGQRALAPEGGITPDDLRALDKLASARADQEVDLGGVELGNRRVAALERAGLAFVVWLTLPDGSRVWQQAHPTVAGVRLLTLASRVHVTAGGLLDHERIL